MADKSSSPDDDPQKAEVFTRREGNPLERLRAFKGERNAVLRPRDAESAAHEDERPDDSRREDRAARPVEYKTSLAEYRRRQRTTPRTETKSGPAPSGETAPAVEDDPS
jgi:hypothetical protein